MSKSNKGSDSSNKGTSKGQVSKSIPGRISTDGKLTVKQAEQIVAPPIKTNPKK